MKSVLLYCFSENLRETAIRSGESKVLKDKFKEAKGSLGAATAADLKKMTGAEWTLSDADDFPEDAVSITTTVKVTNYKRGLLFEDIRSQTFIAMCAGTLKKRGKLASKFQEIFLYFLTNTS